MDNRQKAPPYGRIKETTIGGIFVLFAQTGAVHSLMRMLFLKIKNGIKKGRKLL